MNRSASALLLKAVPFLVALTVATAAAAIVGPPDQPGGWAVGHSQATLIDASRGARELPVEIWYPADGTAWQEAEGFSFYVLAVILGLDSTAAKDDLPLPAGERFPLVVFSHGYGSLALQSVRLMEHLASHGFVVVSVSHTGNTQGDTSSPNPEADRYPDVAFVIDEMAAADADETSPFFGHVDADNTGVAGHSYGGMTSLFMAAGYGELPPDPRVKAIVPVAASANQLSDSQLAGITVPTLLLVGTLDGLRPDTVRASRLIQSTDLFRVDVVGANHTHFANVCDIGQAMLDFGIEIDQWPVWGAAQLIPIWEETCVPPAFPIEEATRLQNLFAAAHFLTYLVGETRYADYLTPEYAAGEPDIAFFVPEPGASLLSAVAIGVVAGLRARRRSRPSSLSSISRVA